LNSHDLRCTSPVRRARSTRRRVSRRAAAASVVVLLTSLYSVAAVAQDAPLRWATRAGGGDSDEGNAVAIADDGSVYVAGHFESTATFGPGEAGQTMLTSAGRDVFIAKYDGNGALLWVRRAIASTAAATAVDLDDTGNVYVVGYFDSALTFDDGGAGEIELTSAENDVFLAKYDQDGDFLWATKAGGALGEYAYGLSVDGSGNSYVTGRYASNPVTFGDGEPNETVLPGLGGDDGDDVFVAKYDTDGGLIWAKSAGGSSANRGADIDVDGTGNSYVIGSFSGTATFGPGETNETILTGPAAGVDDEIFIAKLDPAGNLLWVREGEGQAEDDRGEAVAVDASGNSYATGSYRSRPPFGAQANATQAVNAGSDDIFIVKHDTDGNRSWVKLVVGEGGDFAPAIALAAGGNVVITGYGGTLTFGAEETNEVTLIGPGAEDAFVAKYDSNGSLLWANSAGGSGDDRGQAVAADSAGGVIVAGRFTQTATFGAGENNQTALVSAGSSDIFVAKYEQPAVCGDATGDGRVTAVDALRVLRSSVGTGSCALCVCDVDSSLALTATDALTILRSAVGQAVELTCAAC